ncbi:hypothetical protein [Klebsiella pneumoniae]|uniref:hypothetical protein n=1 Tax=Klebsiella pneumoniae TaxID=573 RepID=UPI001612DC34|nr:hypothetical protein [Klebsiella pneumoniae]
MRRSNKLYYDKWWYIALSSGEINWGKIRGNFNVKNGPNFKLLGTPGKTVFTFDNIDPIKINKLWGHSEPALITIGSNSTISSEYTSSFIMESIKIDYSRQKSRRANLQYYE